MATRIYRYKDPVAWDERLVIESERNEFPRVIHLKRPRLSNRYTVNLLSARDASDFNKNEWMRVYQLEIPHLDFDRETFLIIINSDDGMVT